MNLEALTLIVLALLGSGLLALALILDHEPNPSPRIAAIRSTIYGSYQCTDDYVHVWPARNGICRLEDKR